MTDSIDITKRALALIGTRSQITAFNDGSQEGLYAGLLYEPLRDFLLREGDYDFSMFQIAAVATTGTTPPWTFAWEYPAGALRIRQLIPVGAVPLDPRPVGWSISGASGGVRKIFTRMDIASIFYTAAPDNEDAWEPLFTEAFTRLLASGLEHALANRLEASKERLSQALTFAGIANLRDS